MHYDDLRQDPLAAWTESTFGLAVEPGTDRLVRQRPTRLPDAAQDLAASTGRPVDECERAIRQILMAGSRSRHPDIGRPLFAFRLHQFLSKGDTVHVSLEPEDERHVTSTYSVTVPDRPEAPLFPLAFCRECGQEYLAVARATRSGETWFTPRRNRDVSGGDAANGYLYLSRDHPWPVQPEVDGRLPDSWLVTADDGGVSVLPTRRKHLPERVQVDVGGNQLSSDGLLAAFLPSPFSFCLRCRVSYEQVRGQDFGKLATLDAKGRSSAVSVISASVVRSLQALGEHELDAKARKLLTFVDNRQDASLQAGHFNDFVQVAQLRGALYRAAATTPEGLAHEHVAQRVAETLELAFASFAANPEAVQPASPDAAGVASRLTTRSSIHHPVKALDTQTDRRAEAWAKAAKVWSAKCARCSTGVWSSPRSSVATSGSARRCPTCLTRFTVTIRWALCSSGRPTWRYPFGWRPLSKARRHTPDRRSCWTVSNG